MSDTGDAIERARAVIDELAAYWTECDRLVEAGTPVPPAQMWHRAAEIARELSLCRDGLVRGEAHPDCTAEEKTQYGKMTKEIVKILDGVLVGYQQKAARARQALN